MRVCIDVQSAIAQRAGVGRYTRLLVENLGADRGGDDVRLVYFDFRHHARPLHAPQTEQKAIHWMPGRFAKLCWRTLNFPPYDAFAGAADVYHFPNFTLPPLRRGRAVVTIHDLTFQRYPQFTEERNRRFLTARMGHTLARADAVITVSEFSAGEISLLLGVHRDRVFAIHHGIAAEFTPRPPEEVDAARRRFGLERPYLLCVGTIEPRKNLPLLFETFERMEAFDGDLVLVGMAGWKYEPILERMRASPRAARIRWLRYVQDDDLPALYAGASLFLFPSLYEGFGFPPLEAMACGTPVLASHGGSLPEVLGNGARVLDTYDAEQWADAAQELLTDTEQRRALTLAGRRQAARYSWAETARRTWEVYRLVAR